MKSITTGKTVFKDKLTGVWFDDIVKNEDEDCSPYWTYLCESCKKEYNILDIYLDEGGQGTCGIFGCWNEADYYYDIPKL